MISIPASFNNKIIIDTVMAAKGRGASRSSKKSRHGQIHKILNATDFIAVDLQKGMYVILILTLLILAYVGFLMFRNVMEVAVEKVNIKGDLVYQDQSAISDIINSYTANGFVAVDLNLLHSKLLALPWIYQVSIQRQLPDGLDITLVEEKVVAKWNEKAFITQYAEVITPKEEVIIGGLVSFKGLKHKQVLDLYERVSKRLPNKQLPIIAMHLDERDVLSVELAAGAVLILNIDALDEQLNRWNKIVSGAVNDQLAEIRQADLRYSNGAAVAWKNHVASSNNVH